MKNNLISIIVPVYNMEKYLAVCIESLLEQTYRNFELLLVNDGSKDRSGDICEEYKEKDFRIKVFHKSNEGVSSARNMGLQNCMGEYVTFIDSDDYVKKNYLEELYRNLQTYHVDISICNLRLFDEEKSFQEFCRLKSELITCDNQLDYCKYTILYGPCGKLFTKKVLENIYFSDDLFIGEDSFFVAQIIKKSNMFYYDSRALYMYRMNQFSLTHTKDIEKWNTELTAWERIANLYDLESMTYWSIKLRYLKQFRQFVNRDNSKVSMFQEAFQKNHKAVWKVKDSFIEKGLLFLLAYCPKIYFRLYQSIKRV